MLLNTSFNLKGEPIVLTAEDAIACFARSTIDVLVIEDFLLERDGMPVQWELLARVRPRSSGGEAITHSVYTFL